MTVFTLDNSIYIGDVSSKTIQELPGYPLSLDVNPIIDDDVLKHVKDLANRGKVYVYCKQNINNAIVVGCALFSFRYNILLTQVLTRLEKVYEDKIGPTQHSQLTRLLKPYDFYSRSSPFSNFHACTIKSSKFKIDFPHSEALFHAYKDPDNFLYVQSQSQCDDPYDSKKLGRKCRLRDDWDTVRYSIMLEVLKDKINSYPYVKDTLIKTGIQPLFEHTASDNIWGDGGSLRTGANLLGKAWSQTRLALY
jgi:ribA/ribD-fused uncharacterized protein